MLLKTGKLRLEMASVFEAPRQGAQPAVPDAAVPLPATPKSQDQSRLQRHLSGELQDGALTTGSPTEGIVVDTPDLPPPYLLPRSNFRRHPRVSQAFREGTMDDANKEGFEGEWRVGKLLSAVPFVRKVVQSRPNGPRDADMTDLIARTVPGFIVPDFHIQVKLKRVNGVGNRDRGNRLGRRIAKQMASEDPDYLNKSSEEKARLKKEKKLRERRVYIYLSKEVDGVVTPATNQEIVASFTSQALEVAHYYQNLKPAA